MSLFSYLVLVVLSLGLVDRNLVFGQVASTAEQRQADFISSLRVDEDKKSCNAYKSENFKILTKGRAACSQLVLGSTDSISDCANRIRGCEQGHSTIPICKNMFASNRLEAANKQLDKLNKDKETKTSKLEKLQQQLDDLNIKHQNAIQTFKESMQNLQLDMDNAIAEEADTLRASDLNDDNAIKELEKAQAMQKSAIEKINTTVQSEAAAAAIKNFNAVLKTCLEKGDSEMNKNFANSTSMSAMGLNNFAQKGGIAALVANTVPNEQAQAANVGNRFKTACEKNPIVLAAMQEVQQQNIISQNQRLDALREANIEVANSSTKISDALRGKKNHEDALANKLLAQQRTIQTKMTTATQRQTLEQQNYDQLYPRLSQEYAAAKAAAGQVEQQTAALEAQTNSIQAMLGQDGAMTSSQISDISKATDAIYQAEAVEMSGSDPYSAANNVCGGESRGRNGTYKYQKLIDKGKEAPSEKAN